MMVVYLSHIPDHDKELLRLYIKDQNEHLALSLINKLISDAYLQGQAKANFEWQIKGAEIKDAQEKKEAAKEEERNTCEYCSNTFKLPEDHVSFSYHGGRHTTCLWCGKYADNES